MILLYMTPLPVKEQTFYDLVHHLSDTDKLHFVQEESTYRAYQFLRESCSREATLRNSSTTEPFIFYTPMNREPKAWLAWAKAAIAKQFLGDIAIDSIFFLPSSGTWEKAVWEKTNFFHHAQFPEVLRPEQIGKKGETFDPAQWDEQHILSYTRNRQENGHRGTAPMYLQHLPTGYRDTALVVDDMLAEGITMKEFCHILKEDYNLKNIYTMTTMAKKMQGGIETLAASPDISGIIIPIVANKVDPDTQQIFYDPQPFVLLKERFGQITNFSIQM